MNVLSLFDGISCGQIALNRCGIKYDKYFASEIDKYAITVAQANYPDTVQLGNVLDISAKNLPTIDLLIGGSPCQGFSFAGKGLNFDDPRSKLFFEFVRLKNETNPKYFLLENVNMKREWQDIISEQLQVKPIFINSRLVSAQDRKRLYWTNIPVPQLPFNKNIKVSDIIADGVCAAMRGRRIDNFDRRVDYNTNLKFKQYIECRKDDKTNCITTVCKDNVIVEQKSNRKYVKDIKYRFLTPEECEQLQTVPIGYTASVSKTKRCELLGNAWTVDVICHILKGMYTEHNLFF